MRRIQVSSGKLAIKSSEIAIPAIGTNGDQGVRKARGRSGRRERRMRTAMQTMINASSVPMLTSCPSTLIGKSPEKTATLLPTMIVEIHGVNAPVAVEVTRRRLAGRHGQLDVVEAERALDRILAVVEGMVGHPRIVAKHYAANAADDVGVVGAGIARRCKVGLGQ